MHKMKALLMASALSCAPALGWCLAELPPGLVRTVASACNGNGINCDSTGQILTAIPVSQNIEKNMAIATESGDSRSHAQVVWDPGVLAIRLATEVTVNSFPNKSIAATAGASFWLREIITNESPLYSRLGFVWNDMVIHGKTNDASTMTSYFQVGDYLRGYQSMNGKVTRTARGSEVLWLNAGESADLQIYASAGTATRASGGKNSDSWTSFADYAHTLYWGGISAVIAPDGSPVTDWKLTSSSGINWGAASPVPETQSACMLVAGLAFVGLMGRAARRRQHRAR